MLFYFLITNFFPDRTYVVSHFNVTLVSSVKYESCAENQNHSCRILSLTVFIHVMSFKKKLSESVL